MIELPDDELDKLFRKSSEELDPTFDPEDWNELSKRLDQQDGKTPGAWWRRWWPLGVLALLIPAGLALYFWPDGQKRQTVMEQTSVSPKVDEAGNGGRDAAAVSAEKMVESDAAIPEKTKAESISEKKKHIGGKEQNAESKLKISDEEITKSSSESVLSAARKTGSRLLPRSRSKAGGVYLEPNRSKREGGDGALSIISKTPRRETPLAKAAGLKENNKSSKSADGDRPGNGDVIVKDVVTTPGSGKALLSEAVTQPAEPARTLISASALNGKLLKWNVLLLPDISNPVQELPEPRKPEKSPLSADDQPLMAVRFGYSPDLSTVGLKNFSKPGTSVSLLVEYSILKRLYVQSGAVWSRKDYYALFDEYKLPKTQHVYLPEMTSIDGVCKVLEIPINLRYDISSGQRSRWFAGAGFSSYHMISERYKYNYVNPNDPNAIKYPEWNGETGWYWFSHANVSAGYEYRISRKLSLLAEPSIRVPLKRVGYGNVNLITTGLWLSVRYTPVFK